jgi:methionine aminopeptidase
MYYITSWSYQITKQRICALIFWLFISQSIAENKAVGIMKAGQTFTIEPMINAG